jgi:hypothetical protein
VLRLCAVQTVVPLLSGGRDVIASRAVRRAIIWGVCVLLTNSLAGAACAQCVGPCAAQEWPAQIVPKEPFAPEGVQVQVAPIQEDTRAIIPLEEDESLFGWLTSLSVGSRAWLSYGNSNSNFRAGIAPVASDLHWHNIVAESGEATVGALFFHKLVVTATGGGGTISSGRLTDQDYAITGTDGLFSESLSPIGDHELGYYNADIGWRFCQYSCFFIDGLIGYQYWRERYVALGGTQVVSAPGFDVPPVGTSLPPGPRIFEQYTWQGFEIGGQAVVQVCPSLAFKSQVMFMPLTHFENQDIHYDLPVQSSGIERSSGGFGVFGDFRISYWLCSGLFFEIGYRIWDAEAGKGRFTDLFSSGGEANLPFNQATTLRQGFTVGLSYQF